MTLFGGGALLMVAGGGLAEEETCLTGSDFLEGVVEDVCFLDGDAKICKH